MARIIDKETRIIDVDFGPVTVNAVRPANDFVPGAVSGSRNGMDQVLQLVSTSGILGSFIQYQLIDLSHMLNNNEVYQPVDVSIQRTSPVPLGYNSNGNNFDQIEEYIFIFSRPLNNTEIIANPQTIESFRDMGLDRSEGRSPGEIEGEDAGYPNQTQTLYAEKRMYSYNLNTGATVTGGELTQFPPIPGLNPGYNTLMGMPTLDSVTTWGTMGAITGPSLHCYRVVINRTQTFSSIVDLFVNVPLVGSSQLEFPPVNVSFLAKDANFTEGEYLTRLANSMNSLPVGGDAQA